MPYLLGCDFGGSSAKATLLSAGGDVVATASEEYTTYYPQPGWAEQDADDAYEALALIIRRILAETGIQPDDITAMALDAATHTVVLLDAQGKPVRRAIYWTDKRSTEQADRLCESYQDEIVRLSCNTPSSFWTLPQLMWLSEHEPDVLAQTRHILPLKDYVRYRLTGDIATDTIEAMGTMLLNTEQNRWSSFLCGLGGISASMLPQIVTPYTRMSALTSQAMQDTGLSPKTTVLAGTTDTVMEIYAAGAISPGQATVKLATAGRICSITNHAVTSETLVCYRHVVDGLWYPGAATKSCAASNRWYRDTFGGDYEALSSAAATVPAGCDGLFFHPYLQGEITPYLDDKLRASFTGATAAHTRAHFNRAVLEGVGYSMKDCMASLKALCIAPTSAKLLGGGAKSPLWRQITADMLGIPLQTVENADSSLGSAMLAGVATGVFASHAEAVRACVRVTGQVRPNAQTKQFYNERFALYKDIQAALAPIYHRL